MNIVQINIAKNLFIDGRKHIPSGFGNYFNGEYYLYTGRDGYRAEQRSCDPVKEYVD